MKTYNNILILITMQKEAKPIIEALNLQKTDYTQDPFLPIDLYQRSHANAHIYMAVNKYSEKHSEQLMGSQIASVVTWELIKNFNPDLIINAGVAGAFKAKGANIGDVYIIDNVVFHDREFDPTELSVCQYSLGNFKPVVFVELIEKCSLKIGGVSTGDRVTLIKDDLIKINKNSAILKDMEAAAIAEIAEVRQTSALILKSVTDLVDIKESSVEQFHKNYKLATSNLAEKLKLVVNHLILDNDVK